MFHISKNENFKFSFAKFQKYFSVGMNWWTRFKKGGIVLNKKYSQRFVFLDIIKHPSLIQKRKKDQDNFYFFWNQQLDQKDFDGISLRLSSNMWYPSTNSILTTDGISLRFLLIQDCFSKSVPLINEPEYKKGERKSGNPFLIMTKRGRRILDSNLCIFLLAKRGRRIGITFRGEVLFLF